jgi:hypothetical protein
MRFLIALCLSVLASAQSPLIGVNSVASELPAGARDVVTVITVDPSASGGDMLAVMVMAEGIAIEIELPDGRRVTKATAAAAGFEWEVAGEAQGDDALFPGMQGKVNNLILLPPKAPAGKYRIHADASGLQATSALMAVFMPLAGTGEKDSLKVALVETETAHYADEKVELIAAVFDGDRGVNDAEITGVAVLVDENSMPRGTPMPVKFGPGADGNYHAELPATAAGKYEIGINVKGKYPDGKEFERSAGTSISIEPRRARILSITERPIDDDGNGLIDRIELTARIKVDMPGEYFLTVYVGGMQARGKAELGLGETTMTAMVDRFSLVSAVTDGPYKMSATLFRKEPPLNQAFASRLADAGMTRAYKMSTFDHGPLYFKRTVHAVPTSATGNGPFQQLVVSLDVFTPGGRCFWSGALFTGTVNNIDFVNNSGVLAKGPSQITFPYDGFKISNEADGKPLRISTVLFQCGGLHASLGGFLDLPLFPRGTFVKAMPAFELFSSKATVHMERGKAGMVYFGSRTQGGFDQTLEYTIDGLPDGIVIQDFPATAPARMMGEMSRNVAVDENVSPGSYSLIVHARYKTIERTQALTIIVDR